MKRLRRVSAWTAVMAGMVFVISGITFAVLYHFAFEDERARLNDIVKTHVRMLNHETRGTETPRQAIQHLRDMLAHWAEPSAGHVSAFGRTGEICIARRTGETIEFLISRRHRGKAAQAVLGADGPPAEPMRQALAGTAGTMTGADYRGERVLAATAYFPDLGLGLVAKIDVAEIRAPFLRAAGIIILISVPLIALGAWGFTAFASPMVRRTEESEERFRQIAETIDGAFWMSDPGNTRMIYVSPGYERIWGRPVEEIYRDPWAFFKAVHPEDQAFLRRALNRQTEGEGYDLEYRIVRPDGSIRWVRDRSYPVDGGLGTPARNVGIAEDITEQKNREQALQRFSRAVEQSPATVVITDLEGKIEYVNPKFTQVTGYSAREAAGRTPRMLKSGDTSKEVYGELWRTIASGDEWSGVFRNRRKDGSYYWSSQLISPIKDAKDQVIAFIGIGEDITERRQIERSLVQAQKMESLGNLAGGIAHDLNNLLLPIYALTRMVLQTVPEDAPEHEYLSKVVQASDRAKGLVSRILTFSHEDEPDHKNIDIHATVINTLELLTTTIPSNIRIDRRLDPDTGLIQADSGQIETALMNLVSNAADAIGDVPGRITVSLEAVEVNDEASDNSLDLRPGAYAVLAVSDTGHGIDPEIAARMFEPFFTTKAVGIGTGLGLTMVHGIVIRHGGAVHVDPGLGRGATIEVYLPLVGDRAAAPARRTGGHV